MYLEHTFGDAVFKSRNSTSIMNFPVSGTSIAQTKSSLFFNTLSFISASYQKKYIYTQKTWEKLLKQNMLNFTVKQLWEILKMQTKWHSISHAIFYLQLSLYCHVQQHHANTRQNLILLIILSPQEKVKGTKKEKCKKFKYDFISNKIIILFLALHILF